LVVDNIFFTFGVFFYRRRRPKKRNVKIDPAFSTASSSWRRLPAAAGSIHDDVIDDVTILGDAWNFRECSAKKLNVENVRHIIFFNFFLLCAVVLCAIIAGNSCEIVGQLL